MRTLEVLDELSTDFLVGLRRSPLAPAAGELPEHETVLHPSNTAGGDSATQARGQGTLAAVSCYHWIPRFGSSWCGRSQTLRLFFTAGLSVKWSNVLPLPK
jgi:hypothetical protein